LFSDIIGFTSLVEADVTTVFRHVLGPYVQLVAEAVERCGGNLDKFLADEAMVVFGDPRPVPDHAERAIQCALEIQEGFERLLRGDELRGLPPSGLRQGIHTGPMWAGSFGSRRRMEYSVLGDNVNIGARLCTNAPAEGGITISEATRRATERGCAGEAELPAGRGYRLLPREAVALKAPAGRTADFYGAEGRKVEAWDVEREEPNR